MDNKLSELSKPVAWFTDDYLTDKSATTYSEEMAQRWRDKPWFVGNLYSQEYVSALLAELEASKQYAKERDAENESLALTVGRLRVELHNDGAANAHAYERIRELEKRLATPVRFPDCDTAAVSIMAHWLSDEEVNAWVKGIEFAKQQIRATGFSVSEE